MSEGLVYVGKIMALQAIDNADFILSATVVCGKGGKWQGIVKKGQFADTDLCVVYLPDALIPPSEDMKFMEASGWRVKMRRFRGAPSEVVIMPVAFGVGVVSVGDDLTEFLGVKKYHKPVPAHLQGIAKGHFPEFIPKTDEPNYQRCPELIDNLIGNPFYVTEKADGSSTTAYRWKGEFGICSRNLELERNPDNGYWKVAEKYKVEEKLPEGIAIQWETCGPGIQKNPMGLASIDGFMFSAYDIKERRYLTFKELMDLSIVLAFPTVRMIEWGHNFFKEGLYMRAEGFYKSGKPIEGVVVRSQHNIDHAPISFKIINLDYEK